MEIDRQSVHRIDKKPQTCHSYISFDQDMNSVGAYLQYMYKLHLSIHLMYLFVQNIFRLDGVVWDNGNKSISRADIGAFLPSCFDTCMVDRKHDKLLK